MAKDTDYKRLWRRLREENVRLVNLLFQANERLKTQANLIIKIRDGNIRPEDVISTEETS